MQPAHPSGAGPSGLSTKPANAEPQGPKAEEVIELDDDVDGGAVKNEADFSNGAEMVRFFL